MRAAVGVASAVDRHQRVDAREGAAGGDGVEQRHARARLERDAGSRLGVDGDDRQPLVGPLLHRQVGGDDRSALGGVPEPLAQRLEVRDASRGLLSLRLGEDPHRCGDEPVERSRCGRRRRLAPAVYPGCLSKRAGGELGAGARPTRGADDQVGRAEVDVPLAQPFDQPDHPRGAREAAARENQCARHDCSLGQ
jgi:hypothetical protein